VGLQDDISGAVAGILSSEFGWFNRDRNEASGGMLL